MTMDLNQLLIPEAVLCHLQAADAADAIQRLAVILERKGFVKSTFSRAVLAREETMPTGLPLDAPINAAMPHADIDHVIRPALAVATLEHPVFFRVMINPEETIPVSLVFLLALNEPHAQIEMLQWVATILQNREAVERIWAASTDRDLREAVLACAAVPAEKGGEG
jgi:PTS system galactitol-specific IIA component